MPTVSEEDLARFYREELSPADRAKRLDSMPRDEFQRELRKMFNENRWRKSVGGRPLPKGDKPGLGPFGDGGRQIKGGGTGDRPEPRREGGERREVWRPSRSRKTRPCQKKRGAVKNVEFSALFLPSLNLVENQDDSGCQRS